MTTLQEFIGEFTVIFPAFITKFISGIFFSDLVIFSAFIADYISGIYWRVTE